jgi:hypothetical protein
MVNSKPIKRIRMTMERGMSSPPINLVKNMGKSQKGTRNARRGTRNSKALKFSEKLFDFPSA